MGISTILSLRFKILAVISGSKLKRLHSILMLLIGSLEELVAGFHVSDGGSVEQIGHERQELVAKSMKRHHVSALPREPGAIDHICLALARWVEAAWGIHAGRIPDPRPAQSQNHRSHAGSRFATQPFSHVSFRDTKP